MTKFGGVGWREDNTKHENCGISRSVRPRGYFKDSHKMGGVFIFYKPKSLGRSAQTLLTLALGEIIEVWLHVIMVVRVVNLD